MSSILDALEKAEEERIRELSPGLRPARRTGKGRHWRLPAIAAGVAVLVLINLLFWWFYLRAEPEVEPTATSRQTAAAPEPAGVASAPAARAKPAAKPALSLHEQLRRNTAPSAKPLIEEAQVTRRPPPAAAPIAATPAKVAQPAQEATPAPVVVSAPPAQQLAEPVEAAPAETELARAGPPPARVAPQPPVPTAAATAPVATSEAAARASIGNGALPSGEAPEAQPEQIPLVWELPQTLREKVLLLKSSVHVYSEVPAQRFVIINMRRYAEGDTLPPDDFRLARIDQDGVVIDYGGGLVRLPRR